jgi:hypothetical protein
VTALTGTIGSTAQAEPIHSTADHFLAPSERGTPSPWLAVGLAFGAVGALLVAIGGVGLPVALTTVQARGLVTPDQQGALDAAIRLAPVLFVAGVLHLVAAAGLVAGTSWARVGGMAVAAAVTVVGAAGMAVAGSRFDPFAPITTQNAATATSDAIAILGFVVVAYAAAFVTLLVTRRTSAA